MDPLMLPEGRALAETAAAVSTAVGLLSRMNPKVGDEVTTQRKGPATVGAVVGPLFKVGGPMLVQRRGLAETLATVRAMVGLFKRVFVQVPHQSGMPSETLSTYVATMSLVCSRDREMDTE